mmetsp:Transcript_256/g.526  ORF Transcript_256/g.526 Transcript_256/m.526 type:complete len:206 (+) Transcript_256:364-981(+)
MFFKASFSCSSFLVGSVPLEPGFIMLDKMEENFFFFFFLIVIVLTQTGVRSTAKVLVVVLDTGDSSTRAFFASRRGTSSSLLFLLSEVVVVAVNGRFIVAFSFAFNSSSSSSVCDDCTRAGRGQVPVTEQRHPSVWQPTTEGGEASRAELEDDGCSVATDVDDGGSAVAGAGAGAVVVGWLEGDEEELMVVSLRLVWMTNKIIIR